MTNLSRKSGRLAVRALLSALPALVVAACSDGPSPVSPIDPSFNVESSTPQGVEVCKAGPIGSTATFTVEATGGTITSPATFVLDAQPFELGCVDGLNRIVVWVADSPRPDPLVNTVVTVTEVDATSGIELDRIVAFGGLEGGQDIFPPETSASVTVNYDVGASIIFKNVGEPTGGVEGCTPGYWRQTQHFDSWTLPYSPGLSFESVFGVDAFSGATLLEVVWLRGGGLNALGRHAVAALLSAASPGVDYPIDASEVITMFSEAYASGAFEGTKDQFDDWNNLGCSLD